MMTMVRMYSFGRHAGRAAALPALILAVLLCVTGCRWQRWRAPAPRLERIPVTVLVPAKASEASRESLRTLKRLFPSAAHVTAVEFPDRAELFLEEQRVLVISSAEDFPVALWPALENYLDRGGAAVFVGLNPFAERVGLSGDGQPKAGSDFVGDLVSRARSVDDFSSVQAWQHLSSWDEIKGRVRLARVPQPGWAGLAVEVVDFDSWDALVLEEVPAGRIAAEDNTLVFFARGGPHTSRIVVECDEEDGSRWFHEVRLSDAWEPVTLHESAFRFFHGGLGRGGDGDHLSLSRVRRISMGLSAHLAPQRPGDHVFELSDVRLAQDDRPPEQAVLWPDLPLLSPPFRRYDLRAVTIRSESDHREYPAGGVPAQSPLPRERGWGGESGAAGRWIPLFSAFGEKGELLGWPASIYCEARPNAPLRHWAWVGLEPTVASRQVLSAMITEAVRRLHTGTYLIKTGSPAFSFQSGAPIIVTSRCASKDPLPAGLRISAELQREGERFPGRRVLSAFMDDCFAEVHLGLAPRGLRRPEKGIIRLRLEDPTQRLAYDVVEQPVLFLPAPEPPLEADWLKAIGGHFAFRGRRIFLLGINYWPFSANGRMPGEHNRHWLDPAVFDPHLVERDLDLLAEAGINTVSIQYHEIAQAPQLRYFVEAARQRNIRVHLFMAHLQPLHQDLAKARALFEAADLASESGVFAIDVAWEPHLGREAERRRFDPAWRSWLVEQYGSVEHAEAVIGVSLWRNGEDLTGPPDEQLMRDGPHRVAVAVYRRFVDDYMSRQYGHVVRQLRAWGAKQLISARTGYGGTGSAWADPFFPMDPASGAAHFDFICPEGWGLHGGRRQFMGAGFITAYCRGVSGGKPVMWLEFGSSVGPSPMQPDLANQARVYEEVFDMVLRSRGAAALGWWYPGGLRVEENSDMGVANPDGSWRPVGRVYREFGNRIRREAFRSEPWRGREVNRDADARGLSALWEQWRDVYAVEMESRQAEEVRLPGFGKRSREIQLKAVGGAAFMDPAPMESLNAEWGVLQCDGEALGRAPGEHVYISRGERLRLEIINTGSATWDASQEGRPRTAWIAFTHETGRQILLPLPPTAFGARASVSWMATDPGTWIARPLLSGAGGFGEPLHIKVQP